MRRLKLTNHLPVAALEQRYRQAKDPVARSHWHILWLLAQGRATALVADTTGYSKTWIYTIVQRYNQAGAAGVGDQRHANPGAQPLLTPDLEAELAVLLEQPAPAGGLWTSKKVADWMAAKLGHPVHVPRGWEALQRLDYRPVVPRPQHVQADPIAQATFQKKVAGGRRSGA